jgi:ABC-type dipeptide/oligopeptide/nickel transport system permease subunit
MRGREAREWQAIEAQAGNGPTAWQLSTWRPSAGRGAVSPVWRRLRRKPETWLGAALVLAALLTALFAPWLAPQPPDVIDLNAANLPPAPGHLAGTDLYGRDLLSRLLYGGRATLATAGTAVALSLLAGTALGLVAGYSRGWIGQMCVAAIDLLLAFPALLLALLVVALLGPGLPTLATAVGIAGIPNYARLVRSVTLGTRAAPFVEAARALGAGHGRILLRHLLPAVVGPVLAWTTLDLGWAILNVAGLGFLGLGAAPPLAEWGLMLFEGREYVGVAPWTSAFPGLAISLTVLGATLLGDALTVALSPIQDQI